MLDLKLRVYVHRDDVIAVVEAGGVDRGEIACVTGSDYEADEKLREEIALSVSWRETPNLENASLSEWIERLRDYFRDA